MKLGIYFAFFLISPLFSCARVYSFDVEIKASYCTYVTSGTKAMDNKDYQITFTPDFGRKIFHDDEQCLLVKVGGVPYYYDVHSTNRPWTFENNVLTIKSKIINGKIEVTANADIVSELYQITYNTHSYTVSAKSYNSGDYIQIDKRDFYLTFVDDIPASRDNFVITASDNRFDKNACTYQNGTFTIPKAQLGCDINVDVL